MKEPQQEERGRLGLVGGLKCVLDSSVSEELSAQLTLMSRKRPNPRRENYKASYNDGKMVELFC